MHVQEQPVIRLGAVIANWPHDKIPLAVSTCRGRGWPGARLGVRVGIGLGLEMGLGLRLGLGLALELGLGLGLGTG